MSERKIAGIRFQRSGKVYYYDPGELQLEVNDQVVVEGKQGQAIGKVVIASGQVVAAELPEALERVVRKAEPADLERRQRLIEKEEKAAAKCRELVTKLDLPMKVLRAESSLDGGHVTIFFTAPDKVDFRQLAREMAGALRARVELRQVGARDASKALGGIGKCGCQFCCSTFLIDFQPLSIKMAKEQNLSLDPTKISGACGRLLCCLRFENDLYHEMKRKLPNIGKMVNTPNGEAKIIGINALKETVTVRTATDAIVELPAAQVESRQENIERRESMGGGGNQRKRKPEQPRKETSATPDESASSEEEP